MRWQLIKGNIMNDLTKDFDESLSKVQKYIDAGEKALAKTLIAEIRIHNYTTIEQVIGSLHNHLERLGVMTSEQYEAEARADYFSSEQFPNV